MALSGHPLGCDHWGQPTGMEIGEGGPRIAEPPKTRFRAPAPVASTQRNCRTPKRSRARSPFRPQSPTRDGGGECHDAWQRAANRRAQPRHLAATRRESSRFNSSGASRVLS